MKRQFVRWSMALGMALLGMTSQVKAEGDGGPLIDALVKKGVLSSQEGEEIRADMLGDYSATPGGMLQFGIPNMKGVKLYGDARFRYEIDNRTKNVGSNSGMGQTQDRDRNRYRLRFGADFLFSDNFKGGIRLATTGGGDHNSANSDFGTGVKSSNTNDNIRADLIYLTYSNAFGLNWLELTAGRQLLGQNIVTSWTWDSDINPDGGLVKLGDFHPFSKDFTVGGTSGIYTWMDWTDNNYVNPGGSGYSGNSTVGGVANHNDSWMVIEQVDLSYKFSNSWKARVSPGYVGSFGDSRADNQSLGTTSGTGYTGGYTATNGQPTGLNDIANLDVFFIDAQVDTPFFLTNTTGKLYGEYGVNFGAEGAARRYDATNGIKGNNVGNARNQFGLVGYQILGNKGKGKGAWVFDATYAYYEAYSWSGALIDSDWNGGTLNGQGFGLKATYNFTDNISGTVNWRHSNSIDKNLGNSVAAVGGASGDFSKTDLIQVDLNWKF